MLKQCQIQTFFPQKGISEAPGIDADYAGYRWVERDMFLLWKFSRVLLSSENLK